MPGKPQSEQAGDPPADNNSRPEQPKGSELSQKLNKEIDEEKRKKSGLIIRIKKFRQRLAYKLSEQEALKGLVELNKNTKTKNIGYLRRRKENIEFRIATEAYTLEEERELIRKKEQIDKELEEAIKGYRLRKKAEFIIKDIAELTKGIEQTTAGINEIEKKLDILYANLRQLSGAERRKRAPIKRELHDVKPVEISLADIAVIKDKKEEKPKDDGV